MCRDSFFLLCTETQISYAEVQDLTETLLTCVGRSLRQAPEYTPGNYEYDQMGMSGKQFQRLNIQFHKFIILLRYWGQKIKK